MSAYDHADALSGGVVETLGLPLVAAVGSDGMVDGSGKPSLLKNDVMLSVVFEMMRIYTHPFLAGCSEEACMESGDDEGVVCGDEGVGKGINHGSASGVEHDNNNNVERSNDNGTEHSNDNGTGHSNDNGTGHSNDNNTTAKTTATTHHTTPNLADNTYTSSCWSAKFRKASGKICVLEFLLNCLFQVVSNHPYDVGLRLQYRRRVLQVSSNGPVLGALSHPAEVAR